MAKFYENKDKEIICPICGNLLTLADGKDNRLHKLACKKCRKWIWFVPKNEKKTRIKNIPNRTQSSGMVFY